MPHERMPHPLRIGPLATLQMTSDEIYLDANATTPVLPQARAAALEVMQDGFGNPSSAHTSGLRARARMSQVRATARRVLGVADGELIFVSGATEGIQTAVFSALNSLAGRDDVDCVLYGATEHSAVPQALRHWNGVLGLGLAILEIPVGRDGAHDLAWLRAHAGRAGLVCTMAANNETGVVSDLSGIAAALAGSPALWLVDGVQALGKMALDLVGLPIHYAAFSGHKLYAPKGIGLLYVRQGAPLTPIMAGGGQEGAMRSGTENLPAIAALGAVLQAMEDDFSFRDQRTLEVFRDRLSTALQESFPGLVFNAPQQSGLPTTLNFSVPGVSSRLIIDAFDAAGLRVSGGSACSAASRKPSHVLSAMGLPLWQAESAVRLSFGPAATTGFIDEACQRIRRCGSALRKHGLVAASGVTVRPPQGITRFSVNGACCYALVDAESRQCIVIDPLPELTPQLVQWKQRRGLQFVAILDTHSHGDHQSSADALRRSEPALAGADAEACDGLGWPRGRESLEVGTLRLSRLAVPGHTIDSTAYLLSDADGQPVFAFVGDTVMPGALGRSDFEQSAPQSYGDSLRRLCAATGRSTILLPGHDYEDHLACTFDSEVAAQPLLAQALKGELDPASFASAKTALDAGLGLTRFDTLACGALVGRALPTAPHECEASMVADLLRRHPDLVVVDVRDLVEHELSPLPDFGVSERPCAAPLDKLVNRLPGWLRPGAQVPLLLVCRSGNRSAIAARALARLGHRACYSLAGGLALWPAGPADSASATATVA